MRRLLVSLSVVIVVLLGVVSTGNGPATAQEGTPAAATDIETAARQAIDALNEALTTGDTTAIDAVFADDYVDHTPDIVPPGGGASGREELKASFEGFRAAISEAGFTVEDVLVDGDQAAVRFTVRGTLDPMILGLPGDPQPLEVGGVVILRIAEGQVVESWDYDQFAERLMAIAMATPTP